MGNNQKIKMTSWSSFLNSVQRSVPESFSIWDFISQSFVFQTSIEKFNYKKIRKGVCRRKNIFEDYLNEHRVVTLRNSDNAELFLQLLAIWDLGKVPLLVSAKETDSFVRKAQNTCGSKIEINQFTETTPIENEQSYRWNLKQEALILLTSGSSGEPKALSFSFENLISSALTVANYFELKDQDSWALTLPLHHMAGFMVVFRCLLSGAKVSEGKKGNLISLVPTQLEEMLQNNDWDKNCRAFFVGGAKLEENLKTEAQKKGLPIFQSYGLTELSSTVAIGIDQLNLLPHVKAGLSSKNKLILAGPSLYIGHYQNGSFIEREQDNHETNDLAEIMDNEIKLLGRSDRVFISSGENIDPLEIEKCLHETGRVANCKIIPFPDHKLGMKSVAFVDSSLSLQEIKSFLTKNLHPYKVPKEIYPYPKNIEGIKPSLNDFSSVRERKITLLHGFLGSPDEMNKYFPWKSIELYNEDLLEKEYSVYINEIAEKVFEGGKQTLIGYSLGGRIALQLAKRFPEKVESLVLISSHPGIEDQMERSSRLELDQSRFSSFSTMKDFLISWYSNPMWGKIENLDQKIDEKSGLSFNIEQKACAYFSPGILPSQWSFLKETKIPTLYFAGEYDQKYLQVSAKIREENPSIKVEVVPQSGHNPLWQNPAFVAKKLYQFLKI